MSEERTLGAVPATLPMVGDLGQLKVEPNTDMASAEATEPSTLLTSEIDYLPTFLAETHSYISQYIQGADQKAIFLFSSAAALLAFLYQDGASERWLKTLAHWGVIGVITFITMVALAFAAVVAIGVVKPRLPGGQRNLVSFLGIALYKTPHDYSEDLAHRRSASLLLEKAQHCHTLAVICRRKYLLLRWVVILETLGVTGSVLYFLLAHR
jgi:pycsar effector protein